MDTWRCEPTAVDQVPSGTKLALFIDESGKSKYKGTTENSRFFTLCGCLFTIDSMRDAQRTMVALKEKYWRDGKFAYKRGKQRVTFHMSEIALARKGYSNSNNPFCKLKNDIEPFYEEYKSAVREMDFLVFSVTVDKLEMLAKYTIAWDPYEYALKLLFERVRHCVKTLYDGAENSVVVMLEQEGPKEDAINHRCIMDILDKGTDYQKQACFKWIKGVYFCPKRSDDGRSYYGLEVADFCAYPIKMHFAKADKANEEFEIIEGKIYKTRWNEAGYGLKKVP